MANSAFTHEPSFTIPGSTTDNAVIRWDGTSGTGQLNSGIIINDSNVITGVTSLTVDNLLIDGNTISSTAGTDLFITPLSGQQLILDGTIIIDAGVVTAATSITSTQFVGGGVGLTALVAGNITSGGTFLAQNGSALTALNGTQVTTGTLPAARIGADSIVEAKLDVSNGPTNGQFLQAQSGEGGGLTWAAATSTYTDALVDNTVNNLLVLRNVHNEVSTLTSTTVVDGGPWEFFDGDQATLSKALVLLGGYKVTFPSSTNQRGFFRFPTGFGSDSSPVSVTSAQDWTITARIVMTGTASLDFFMGVCMHTDSTNSSHNAASRNYVDRIGIAIDGISDNYHVFVDDDGTETQEDSSTSPSGGAVHRVTLKIRNNGALVQGFLDGVQMGSDITSNIPTITAGMLICGMQAKGSNPAAQTCEIQDLIAYREA